VTRLALCSALCALTIVLALVTAALQSRNRERGIALDRQKQECDMLEAVNGDRCQKILARDWGPLPDVTSPPRVPGNTPAAAARTAPALAALSQRRAAP
jgi:hypothetical protein